MVATSDFIGKFQVTVNEFTVSKLQLYIDRYEENYLRELLGLELYDLYIATPLDPLFVAIESPFVFQSTCDNQIYESQGMKDMLTGFIFFMYTRDLYSSQSIVGTVKQSNENSTIPTNVSALLWQRYNESILSYDAIQQYIRENLTDYPTFKGVEKDVIIPYF
jgi:hypothetical protein